MNISKQAKNSFIEYILQNEPQRTYTADVYQTYIVVSATDISYFKSITTALQHYKNECNYTAALFQCRAYFAKYGDDDIKVIRLV